MVLRMSLVDRLYQNSRRSSRNLHLTWNVLSSWMPPGNLETPEGHDGTYIQCRLSTVLWILETETESETPRQHDNIGSTSKAVSADSTATSQASKDLTTSTPQPPSGSEVSTVITDTTCCNNLLSTSQPSGSPEVSLWVLVFLIRFLLTKFVRFPNNLETESD
jgi:hypothetical protein